MKVLLVGEYSRLHNSLKEGLQALGHEVTLVSTGDQFKKYPSDILLTRKFDTGFGKKIKVGIHKISGIDITSRNFRKQFLRQQQKFQGFDVVQLINESPFSLAPQEEERIISMLAQNNDKLFLLSCGTDYISVKYAFERKFRYSIFDPLFDGKVSKKDFDPILKYLSPKSQALHRFVYKNIEGVIASDMDYDIPLQGHPKYLGLIPNPINLSKLKFIPMELQGRITIFHGINRANYYKKGNDLFEATLQRIVKSYPEKVEIITVESIPYSEYIEKYNSAHILLDQIYAFDQGYNALEAMAKGKVVFTGAETEFLERYGLQPDEVCINALPDVDYLYGKIEELILKPEKLLSISKNARAFIEREHDCISIAKRYVETWRGKTKK